RLPPAFDCEEIMSVDIEGEVLPTRSAKALIMGQGMRAWLGMQPQRRPQTICATVHGSVDRSLCEFEPLARRHHKMHVPVEVRLRQRCRRQPRGKQGHDGMDRAVEYLERSLGSKVLCRGCRGVGLSL